MRMPKARKAVEFHQLCAVVKMLLQQDPSIDDAEWKGRTRDHLAKMEFDEPDAEVLGRAMTQVEYALRKTIGVRLQRPIPLPSQPAPQASSPEGSKRTHHPAGWDIVVRLMAKLQAAPVSAPSLPKPDGPRELLSISEAEAVNEFWSATRDNHTDRLALLKAFAEIAIVRPAGWDFLAIRADAHHHALASDGCFVCRQTGRVEWHHVIQIQHGGSNYSRNRVALCEMCHWKIHPWLPKPTTTAGSWHQIGGCSDEAVGMLDRLKNRA